MKNRPLTVPARSTAFAQTGPIIVLSSPMVMQREIPMKSNARCAPSTLPALWQRAFSFFPVKVLTDNRKKRGTKSNVMKWPVA
jgi:hypothetical protein